MILIKKNKTKIRNRERNETSLMLALLAKYEFPPAAEEGHLLDPR